MSERRETMATLIYGCGCRMTTRRAATVLGSVEALVACDEHGAFASVQRALRIAREALEEAHEQLPPGPQRAA